MTDHQLLVVIAIMTVIPTVSSLLLFSGLVLAWREIVKGLTGLTAIAPRSDEPPAAPGGVVGGVAPQRRLRPVD